eukprot:2769667-Amphidinium_carterae.1
MEDEKQRGGPSGPAPNRLTSLVHDLGALLHSTAPKQMKYPSKPWITQESWTKVRLVANLRRTLRQEQLKWQSGLLSRVFRAWASKSADVESCAGDEWVAWTVCRFRRRLELFLEITRLRTLTRRDRRKWFEDQCVQLRQLAEQGKYREYHQLLRRLTYRREVQHGVLKNKKGVKAYKADDIAQTWSEHWQDVFQATELDLRVDFDCYAVSGPCKHEQYQKVEATEVLHALKSSAGGKASPDSVTIDVLKSVSGSVAPILAEAFTEYLQAGTVPTSFRGGVVVPVYKRGPKDQPSNYRPICLTSNASKLFNKVLLERLGFYSPPASQFSGAASSVEYPILCTSQMVQHAKEHNLSLGLLFLDLQQAFDNVSRPYLEIFGWGATRDVTNLDADELTESGVPYATALKMVEHFASHLPVLIEMGVPEPLLDVMRESNAETWLQLSHQHGGRTLATGQGV